MMVTECVAMQRVNKKKERRKRKGNAVCCSLNSEVKGCEKAICGVRYFETIFSQKNVTCGQLEKTCKKNYEFYINALNYKNVNDRLQRLYLKLERKEKGTDCADSFIK